MKSKIVAFLLSHPLISINGLEKVCNIPQGALAKTMKGNDKLSNRHLDTLGMELAHYGLKIKKKESKTTSKL